MWIYLNLSEPCFSTLLLNILASASFGSAKPSLELEKLPVFSAYHTTEGFLFCDPMHGGDSSKKFIYSLCHGFIAYFSSFTECKTMTGLLSVHIYIYNLHFIYIFVSICLDL